jgi:MFS family permease
VPSGLAALRVPAYRWWFVSQILSVSGNMAQAVGLAWLILQLHGGGLDLGLFSAAAFGPLLLFGAWAGALLDHVDRRRALIVTQFAFIGLSSTLAIFAGVGAIRIWMVFAFAFASGTVFAIDAPARQVYVLDLVGSERTASAVGLAEVIVNASRALGPATSGVLIATLGVTWCFAANAASFVPPLLVLLAYRPLPHPKPPVPLRSKAAVREGFAHVRQRPAIFYTMLMAVASGMLFNTAVALPVLATKVLGLGGVGYGALIASFGLGAIPGAFAAARTIGVPSGRPVRTLCLLSGVTVILVALAPTAAVAYALMGIAGFVAIWFIALANTLVQLRAAPHLRGRVMAVWTMAQPGMNPVTGVLAGAVTQLAGARIGFGLGGAALMGTAALGWRALSE